MFQSKKSLVIVAVALLIAAITGWSAYYLKQSQSPKSSIPPVLKLTKNGGEKFQGIVSQEKSPLIFRTATPNDGQYVFSPEAKSKLKKGEIGITAGAAYYYSSKDVTTKELMGSLLSMGESNFGNQFLIAYFDPSQNKYLISPSASDELETAIFDNAGVGSLMDNFTVKKFRPFVIYSMLPSDAPDTILSASVSVDQVDPKIITVKDLLGFSRAPVPGWYIIPISKKALSISAFLNPIRDYVVGYYPQKDSVSFGSVCYIGQQCNGLSDNLNFIWLEIGVPVERAVDNVGMDVIDDEGDIGVDDGGDDEGSGDVASARVCGNDCFSAGNDGNFNLICEGLACKENQFEMTIADLMAFACIRNPRLCSDYRIPAREDLPTFEEFYSKKINGPGWVDPSPVEDRIRETMADTMKAGDFMGFATDPIKDKFDSKTEEKLGKYFETQVGEGNFAKLTEAVMSKEFANKAAQSKALGGVYDTIAAFEKTNGVEVSQEDAAALIGTILQDVMSDLGAGSMDTSIGQVLSENSTLKGAFSGALKTTFTSNSTLLQGAGLEFNAVNNSFMDLGESVKVNF